MEKASRDRKKRRQGRKWAEKVSRDLERGAKELRKKAARIRRRVEPNAREITEVWVAMLYGSGVDIGDEIVCTSVSEAGARAAVKAVEAEAIQEAEDWETVEDAAEELEDRISRGEIIVEVFSLPVLDHTGEIPGGGKRKEAKS